MGTGWLLDVTDDRDSAGVLLWLKDDATRRVIPRRVAFRPPFLATGPPDALDHAARTIASRDDVAEVAFRTERPSLFDHRPRRVLAVTARRNAMRRRLAESVDALGDYHAFTLYDVDLGAPQLYLPPPRALPVRARRLGRRRGPGDAPGGGDRLPEGPAGRIDPRGPARGAPARTRRAEGRDDRCAAAR